MMSPLEPKHLRPQQDAMRHVTTEVALRWIEDAAASKKNQLLTNDTRTRLAGLSKLFASMDPKSRASLLVQLAKKESEVKARLNSDERGEYAFPEGAILTRGLMHILPPSEARRSFWDVLAAFGGDDRKTVQKVSAATSAYDFIAHTKEAFSAPDWRDIGARILNVYAHDTRIPEDVRGHAADSYLRHSFRNIYNVLFRAEDNAEEDAGLSPRYVDGEVKELLKLQPAITGIILDEHLGSAFRTEMLSCTSFRICPEDTRKKIAELAYTRGVDEKLSEGVIDWLKFPRARIDPGAVNPYRVLEKVVQERKDAPSIQLSAMEISLDQDALLAPRSATHSDIGEFTKTLDNLWKDTPHHAQPESRVYEKLTKTVGGRLYIQKMMGGDDAMQRITGVHAALRGDPSLLLDQKIIRRCVNDIVTELREVKNRSFCYTAVETLCDAGSFASGDMLVLRGLKGALSKLHDERAANAGSVVGRVLKSLPNILHIRPEE